MGKQAEKDKGTSAKKSCFIITPIGGDTEPIRRHIEGIIDAAIIPSLEPQFEVKIAHRMFDPTSITKQIIQQLHESDLVVANLTGLNPNVMYELAIRHCEGSPVIVIAENNTKLPFDINTERTIFYINDAKGVLELKDALAQCVQNLQFDQELRGPVYDALHTLGVEEKVIKNVSSSEDADVLQFILSKLERIEEIVGRNLLSENETDGIEVYLDNKYDYGWGFSIDEIGELAYKLRKILNETPKEEIADELSELTQRYSDLYSAFKRLERYDRIPINKQATRDETLRVLDECNKIITDYQLSQKDK